mgnify:CR=1 FL=1
MYRKLLKDYIPDLAKALAEQLDFDQNHWGDTWKKRERNGQELRTKARFDDYFDKFVNAGIPVPWLKIIGGALICWVRDLEAELPTDVSCADKPDDK